MKTLYFDMDGVLCDFEGQKNALERYKTEKGFFKNLEPIWKNLNQVKALIREKKRVYILTASPNKQADKDKKAWIKKYLPQLPMRRVKIVRNGKPKIKSIRRKRNSVLFDDYGKNIREWKKYGGFRAVKVTKDFNLPKSVNILKTVGVI